MSRVQLALNVSDLEASVTFYSTLFGVEPHKRRPGYANFAIAEPPLKLVLIEVPADDRGTGTAGALNHLGVEVNDVTEVEAQAGRLREAGLAAFDEKDTTCCYALQDKVWVHDPAGAPWEIYTIKDDDPANPRPATASLQLLGPADDTDQGTACCTPGSDDLPVPTTQVAAGGAPARIRVFEPALCCNTGVCGPDPADDLVRFTADLGALQELGIDIERHNLANDPTAFAADDTVRTFLHTDGSEGLPLVLVDGVAVVSGRYPGREELLQLAGVGAAVVPAGATTLEMLPAPDAGDPSAGGCCSGTSCC